MVLVGQQEGHPACKNWVVRYWRSYLSEARCKRFEFGPADATATPSSLAPVKSRMVYLSGASLPRLSCKLLLLHPFNSLFSRTTCLERVANSRSSSYILYASCLVVLSFLVLAESVRWLNVFSSGECSVWTVWYEVKVWWSNVGKVSCADSALAVDYTCIINASIVNT